MSYRNKYGITKIKSKRIDNLQINWDFYRTPKSKFPVLLFTPDMNNTNTHYHIKLDRGQTRKLAEWLIDYLHDTRSRERKYK